MPLIAQYAYQFRCKRFVQDFDYRLAIAAIRIGYGAVLDVLARPLTNSLDVCGECLLAFRSAHGSLDVQDEATDGGS